MCQGAKAAAQRLEGLLQPLLVPHGFVDLCCIGLVHKIAF